MLLDGYSVTIDKNPQDHQIHLNGPKLQGLHKCLCDLLKLRAEKRKAEIGFEPQEHSKPIKRAVKPPNSQAGEAPNWSKDRPSHMPLEKAAAKGKLTYLKGIC